MDDQSKEFIESSEAVEREEYERRRIQRAARSRSGSVKSTSTKLGAEKLTPEEQRRRFIEAAREAGASENEAEFDASLKRIVKAKPAS